MKDNREMILELKKDVLLLTAKYGGSTVGASITTGFLDLIHKETDDFSDERLKSFY